MGFNYSLSDSISLPTVKNLIFISFVFAEYEVLNRSLKVGMKSHHHMVLVASLSYEMVIAAELQK